MIAVLCLVQTALLLIAWTATLDELRERQREAFAACLGDALRVTAGAVADRLSADPGTDPGDPARDRAISRQLGRVVVPDGVSIDILGPDGSTIRASAGTSRAGVSARGGPRADGDGPVFTATATVPGRGLAVAASMRQSDLIEANDRVIEGGVPFIVLTLTATGGFFIVSLFVLMRRFESDVEVANKRLQQEAEQRYGQSLETRYALIVGLAKLADSRDAETGDHLERISIYAVTIAERYGNLHRGVIDCDWVECLRLAATLHDIGKVGVPDAVLLKPGRLTDHERRIVETHTNIGADSLSTIRDRLGEDPLIAMSIDIARSHHERWDGAGYPDGLKGEAIPLAARIVAVADVYDAMTSDRIYKAAMPHAEVIRMILSEAGRQFDPDVVEAFRRAADDLDTLRVMSARAAYPPRMAA